MHNAELVLNVPYNIRSPNPETGTVDWAVAKREYTEPSDGITWVEIEIEREQNLIIEYYPKARFLEMIINRPSIQTYNDRR